MVFKTWALKKYICKNYELVQWLIGIYTKSAHTFNITMSNLTLFFTLPKNYEYKLQPKYKLPHMHNLKTLMQIWLQILSTLHTLMKLMTPTCKMNLIWNFILPFPNNKISTLQWFIPSLDFFSILSWDTNINFEKFNIKISVPYISPLAWI